MELKAGVSVRAGYIFLGYFSPIGKCDALKYLSGREWREVATGNEAFDKGAKLAKYMAGWAPIEEYVAYIESYRNIHPSFTDKTLAEIEGYPFKP